MAAKIMSLYSIAEGNVKSRKKIDGEQRLKIPRFSEFERERDVGMFMGGASHNVVSRHVNVHRTAV